MPIRYLKVVDTATHEEHLIDTGGVPATDAAPTQGSTNPVSSGGVYSALAGKQNTLTFDSTPTSRSSNPVSSGGVYTALQAKQDSVPYTTCYTEANVAAKEASTSAANFVLAVGARILVSFSYQNTASSPTLNVDGTGAKAIYFKGSQITDGNEIALVGGLIFLVYDGFRWNIVGNYLNTLNTAGASDFSNHKLYPVGALYPYDESVTYSNSNIYFGSDNEVYSNGKKVAHADEVTSLNSNIAKLQEGVAIIVTGDTAHVAVPAGGYAYLKNNTHGLSEGMYKNTSSAAFPVSGGTANSTVFTAVTTGAVNDAFETFNSKIENRQLTVTPASNVTIIVNSVWRTGNVVMGELAFTTSAVVSAYTILATITDILAQYNVYMPAIGKENIFYIDANTGAIAASAELAAGTYRISIGFIAK